jgi:two-component system cell cycle response regulator
VSTSPLNTCRIGVIGFTDFERGALASFFKLATGRSWAYVYEPDADAAHVLIVDGDRSSALAAASGPELAARSIFVGAHAVQGQLGQLARPLNPVLLVRLLDATLPHLAPRALVAAPPPVSPTAVVPPDLAPAPFGQILVVDESDVDLRFMEHCLTRFGFQVQLAHSGEDALQKVAQTDFRFVFLEIDMSGIDGHQTCRQIKQRTHSAGRGAPEVVMLTRRSGHFDRIRAALAGCDGYLTKPLDHAELMKLIGDHVVTDATLASTIQAQLFDR